MERKQNNHWLTGLIIGGVVGSVIALLTTSRTGEETRKMISEKSINLRDKAVETAENTRSRVEALTSSFVEDTRDKVNQLKDSGRKIKNAETEVIKECIQEAKKALVS